MSPKVRTASACSASWRSRATSIIFATSFGFGDYVHKVAKQFPDVKFEWATGNATAPNVSTYNAKFHEGRAVVGTIAGMMTKTNTIAYIGSFPIPEVRMGINAYAIAARKVNPEVKVKVVYVDSWFDPAKEADAARALIDQGVDVITQHTDGPAALQVAEERGIVGGFGQGADMSAFAPKSHLTAIIDVWGPHYVEAVQAVLDGTWGRRKLAGHRGRRGGDRPYNEKIPAEVVAKAERGQERHRRRHAPSLRRPDQRQCRRRARRGRRRDRRWRVLGRRLVRRRRRGVRLACYQGEAGHGPPSFRRCLVLPLTRRYAPPSPPGGAIAPPGGRGWLAKRDG
jgi:hypothetical protein